MWEGQTDACGWIKALWEEDLHAMRLANNGPVFSQMPTALWRCSNLGLPDLILPGFVVHHLGADPSLGLPWPPKHPNSSPSDQG